MAIVFPYGIFAFDALQLAMEARLVNPGAVRGCVGGEATLTDHSLRQGVAMFATVPFQNGTVANLMSLIAPGLLTYLSYSYPISMDGYGWRLWLLRVAHGCACTCSQMLPTTAIELATVQSSACTSALALVLSCPLKLSWLVTLCYASLSES